MISSLPFFGPFFMCLLEGIIFRFRSKMYAEPFDVRTLRASRCDNIQHGLLAFITDNFLTDQKCQRKEKGWEKPNTHLFIRKQNFFYALSVSSMNILLCDEKFILWIMDKKYLFDFSLNPLKISSTICFLLWVYSDIKNNPVKCLAIFSTELKISDWVDCQF